MKANNSGSVIALFLAVAVGGTGCAAYANAANGILNSGVMKMTDGHVEVTNGLALSICKVTMFSNLEPNRQENDLNTSKPLEPGASSTVSIPHFGKAETPTPEGTTYGLRVYACVERTAYEKMPGSLISTVPSINPKSRDAIILH